RYREPFILCCLEGRSNAEAAEQLSCSEGTLSSQLTRARERLRTQLTRRGIVLSAAGLAVVMSEMAVTAGVPETVTRSTIQTALGAATGQAAAVGVSAEVLAMSEGVIQTMFLMRLKIAVALLFVIGLGAFAGTYTYHALVKRTPGGMNGDEVML